MKLYILYTFCFYCILLYGNIKNVLAFLQFLILVGSVISWMKSIYKEGYLDINQQKISLFAKFFNMIQFHMGNGWGVPLSHKGYSCIKRGGPLPLLGSKNKYYHLLYFITNKNNNNWSKNCIFNSNKKNYNSLIPYN